MRIAILGAGDMGTAIATPLAANGHDVRLWGTRFDDQIVTALQAGDVHPRLHIRLPNGVTVLSSDHLAEAVAGVEMIVLAVTSPAVDPIFDALLPFSPGQVPIVSLAKGLYSDGNDFVRLISERIVERCGSPVVGVGGPAKANEVAMNMPTIAVFASASTDAAALAHQAFETPFYQVEASTDVVGVELAAALKNAFAIAVGVASGLEHQSGLPHQNLKAALFPAAIREMAAIAVAYRGSAETIYGLAGVGDLSVTVSAGRNRLLGELLGQGLTVREALASLSARGMTIEGHGMVDLGYRFCQQLIAQGRVEMTRFPLLTALYRVLYQDAPLFESLWSAINSQ